MDTATTAPSKYPAFVVPCNHFATSRVLPLLMLLTTLAWTTQAQNTPASLSAVGESLGLNAPHDIQDVSNCTCSGQHNAMTFRYEGNSSGMTVVFTSSSGGATITFTGVGRGTPMAITAAAFGNGTPQLGNNVTIAVNGSSGTSFSTLCGKPSLNDFVTDSGESFRVIAKSGTTGSTLVSCSLEVDMRCQTSPDLNANPGTASPGTTVTFTATYESVQETAGAVSEGPLIDAVITATYDAALWESPSGSCTAGICSEVSVSTSTAGEINFTVAQFNPGETASLEFQLTVVNPLPGGDDDDTVSITMSSSDLNEANAGNESCSAFFTNLPVELISFEAIVDGRDTKLEWATASETNNAGFEVQHRYLGAADKSASEFEALGWIEGAGTTLEAQSYSFSIEDLDPGRHLFRLKQIDFDGAFEFSSQIEVAVEMPEAFLVSGVYPNPFNPEASFSFGVKQSQQVSIALFNVLGQRVLELYQGTPEAGTTQTLRIDASGLQSGTYLLRVLGERFVDTQTITLIK